MKDIIKSIILENQYSKLPEIRHRDLNIPVDTGQIISIIGVRRSGKTYVLYKTIEKLLNAGIDKRYILYLNFEDERLLLDASKLDLILQSYQELYPQIDFEEVYLFFDEIQNVEKWEKFIRRVYDTKTRNIFLTGSNSKLLSSEIATELRGRTISYTIYPLSFKEYLEFKNIKISFKTLQERSLILKNGMEFLTNGGFPETIFVDKFVRLKILQEYFNVMIYRDIIERYKISNIQVLKFFIKKIFASVTTILSVNKTYNDIKSMGYKISNTYLYDYLDYTQSIFLTLAINKYNYSELKQHKSDKKCYIIDTGLLSNIEYSVSKNIGKLFENAVCLEFIKSGQNIFYFKDRYECDFIVENLQNLYPVQVTFRIEDEDTKKREYRGLYEACKYTNTSKGIIITFDNEYKDFYKGIEINVVPFYKYFLYQDKKK